MQNDAYNDPSNLTSFFAGAYDPEPELEHTFENSVAPSHELGAPTSAFNTTDWPVDPSLPFDPWAQGPPLQLDGSRGVHEAQPALDATASSIIWNPERALLATSEPELLSGLEPVPDARLADSGAAGSLPAAEG